MNRLLLLFLLLPIPALAQEKITARTVYDEMMRGIERIRTCTYTIAIEERIFDQFVTGKHRVKLQITPSKVYIYSIAPDAGAEVLYIAGQNNGKALVNPNQFPFVNVNLHPENRLLRKFHQYTVAQMGFGYLYDLLRKYEFRDREKFFTSLHLDPKSVTSESDYYILEIRNNTFGNMNYKVMKGENVTSIARKFYLNDMMILDRNRDIAYFDDVQPGQVITIPNSFAKRIVFHVDKKTHLPLKQIIYDDKGLYSKINYSSFVLNPVIKPEEFTKDYPGYKF